MRSGVFAATSSMSTPPASEAITRGKPMELSMTIPRYSSRSTLSCSSTRTRLTSRPSGPVWWVTSCMPMISPAAFRASSGVAASLMPPPLPRPPAWICALTATGRPSSAAIAAASSAVAATRPPGTGTP